MRLSFPLFCKNLLLNLLIAAQICASAVFGMISLAVISESYFYYHLTSGIDGAYVYMPESAVSYYTDSAVAKYVDSGEISLSRSRQEMVWSYNPAVTDAMEAYRTSEYRIKGVYTFGAVTSELMKSQLKKGSWYSEEAADGEIECVIVGSEKEFPIGSVIDGAEFGLTAVEGGVEGGVWNILKNTYRFKVVGTCGQSAEIPNFMVKAAPAESLVISEIFTTDSYKSEGFFEGLSSRQKEQNTSDKPTVTILCSASAFHGTSLGDPEKNASGDNALFTFADSVSQERRNEILEELKTEAGVADVHTLRENAYLSAKNTTAQYLPIMLCFLSLVIVGVICVATLNMIKNKKTFRTLLICGMSMRQGGGLLALYTVILLAIAAILTLITWTLLSLFGLMPWAQMAFGAPSVLFALGDFLFSALLIMAISLSILKKQEEAGAEA